MKKPLFEFLEKFKWFKEILEIHYIACDTKILG